MGVLEGRNAAVVGDGLAESGRVARDNSLAEVGVLGWRGGTTWQPCLKGWVGARLQVGGAL